MSFKTIILDFDGVLVESVAIKDKAFAILFRDYPEHIQAIMDYHQNHNGVIRFEKFRYIYEQILKKIYTPTIEQELARRFSDLVIEEIIHAPSVAGAESFLKFYYQKIPLYVVSINPSADLNTILNARQLNHYFKDVYAVSGFKADALKNILKKEYIAGREALFIGDSYEDFQAAQTAGIHFIRRERPGPWGPVAAVGYKDFFVIKEILEGNLFDAKLIV